MSTLSFGRLVHFHVLSISTPFNERALIVLSPSNRHLCVHSEPVQSCAQTPCLLYIMLLLAFQLSLMPVCTSQN